MRRMIQYLSFIVVLGFLMAGCSSEQAKPEFSSSAENAMDESLQNNEGSLNVSEQRVTEGKNADSNQKDIKNDIENEVDAAGNNRKVIYNADINIKVKSLAKAQENLERKASKYGGYIVESTTNRYEDTKLNSMMIFRIPQQHFSSFLTDAEDTASDVRSRYVSGQDVTEEYVDLESRLKSKKAVESRLLTFMEAAEKTEDLLKISADLATVQEQIEQLKGRINYLENQSAFSTVTISMEAATVMIPKIDQQDLNTWEKVKKQFAVNINGLLSFASGMVVLFAGNLPIFILIGVLFVPVFFYVKKRKRKKDGPKDL